MKYSRKHRDFFAPVRSYLNFLNSDIFSEFLWNKPIPEGILRNIVSLERFSLFFLTFGYGIFMIIKWGVQQQAPAAEVGSFFLILLVSVATIAISLREGRIAIGTFTFSYIFMLVWLTHFAGDSIAFTSDHIQNDFVFHLAVIISQVLRPGKFPGFPVILFTIIHYIIQSNIHVTVLSNGQLTKEVYFLIWASGNILFVESILYMSIVQFHSLKEKSLQEMREMHLARKVHQNLFPQFEENARIRLSTSRITASKTGGDFYDVVQLREGNMGFFVSDVSGHGISSAMMTAAIKIMINDMPYLKRMDPSAFLTHLDQKMSNVYLSHHCSAVYIFFDFQKNMLYYANAGHPPILFSRDGDPFRELRTEGSLLGFRLSDPIAEGYSIPFQTGDRFLIYTDGLTEYCGKDEEVIVYEDLQPLADSITDHPGRRFVHSLIQKISHLDNFVGFRDDVLVVLLEIK